MTMHTRTLGLLLVLASVAGCSGSGGSSAQLAYTDPSPGLPAWRLVKDPSSTASRLVLNLVGPGIKARGVGFNLKADPGIRFLPFDDGMPVQDTGAFQLRSIEPDTDVPANLGEPVYFAGGVMPGNVLTVGIFQKDRNVAATATNVPLLRIAMEVAPGTQAGPLSLTVVKARIMPEDIGGPVPGPFDSQAALPPLVITKSHLAPIEIAVGTLQVN
jgi:hypothetical protein